MFLSINCWKTLILLLILLKYFYTGFFIKKFQTFSINENQTKNSGVWNILNIHCFWIWVEDIHRNIAANLGLFPSQLPTMFFVKFS